MCRNYIDYTILILRPRHLFMSLFVNGVAVVVNV